MFFLFFETEQGIFFLNRNKASNYNTNIREAQLMASKKDENFQLRSTKILAREHHKNLRDKTNQTKKHQTKN